MERVHCKKAAYTQYVGRPTIFGNPFPVKTFGRHRAVQLYRQHLWRAIQEENQLYQALLALPDDAVLGCWCQPDQLCHADQIIAAAQFLKTR